MAAGPRDSPQSDLQYFLGREADEGLPPSRARLISGPYEDLAEAVAAWREDPDLADSVVILVTGSRGRLERVPEEASEGLAHLVFDWVPVSERVPRDGERIRFVVGALSGREYEGWYDGDERYFCTRDREGLVHRYRTNVRRWHLVVR